MVKKSYTKKKVLNFLAPPFIGFFLFIFLAYPFFKDYQRPVSIFVQDTFKGVTYEDLNKSNGQVYTVTLNTKNIIPKKIYIKEGDILRFVNKGAYSLYLKIPDLNSNYLLYSNEDFFRLFEKKGQYDYTISYKSVSVVLSGTVYVEK